MDAEEKMKALFHQLLLNQEIKDPAQCLFCISVPSDFDKATKLKTSLAVHRNHKECHHIDKLEANLKEEEKKQNAKNSGVCYLTFNTRALAEKFQVQAYFDNEMSKVTTDKFKWATMLKVQAAPMSSDINWHKLGTCRRMAFLKKVFSFVVIFLIATIILTPTFGIELFFTLNTTEEYYIIQLISAYVFPLITIMIGFSLIPFLVDTSAESFEDHESQSS